MATLLGYSGAVVSTDNNPSGFIVLAANSSTALTPLWSLANAGWSAKMSANVTHANAGSQAYRLVVYRDLAGAPGAFHCVTKEIIISSANAPSAVLIDFPFLASVYFPAGSYWPGIWFGTVVTNVALINRNTGTNCTQFISTATYSSTGDPPSTFGTPTLGGGRYVAYATVEDNQQALMNPTGPLARRFF